MIDGEAENGYANTETLIINEVTGIRLNFNDYDFLEKPAGILHLIIGEFIYNGFSVDGFIIVTEKIIQNFIRKYPLTIRAMHLDYVYAHHSYEDVAKVRKDIFEVKLLTVENVEDDFEDDEFIFMLVE